MKQLLIVAIATSLALLCLSCNKNDESEDFVPDIVLNTDANYGTDTYEIFQGEDHSTGLLHHQLPEGTTFALHSIKNSQGKTSQVFQNEYQYGTWTGELDKSTDRTLQALLSKYSLQTTRGAFVDPATGTFTILGHTTHLLAASTYWISLTATYNGTTVILENVGSFTLHSQNTEDFVQAKWKYSSESEYIPAQTSVVRLIGSALTNASANITGYNSNRTYLRLKISDARNIGLDIPASLDFTGDNNLTEINPWISYSRIDDRILLTSPTNRFPVLEEDSTLTANIAQNWFVGDAVDIALSLNVTGAGVYDVDIELLGSETADPLIWPTGKLIYKPNALQSNDFLDNNSQWSYQRMYWSDNYVVFWEKGLGNSLEEVAPLLDIRNMLNVVENAYDYYYNTMQFVNTQTTSANDYRIYIMLHEQSTWLATGAGYDSQIGATWVNYTAANSAATMVHEIGHTFQYINHVDGNFAFTGSGGTPNYMGSVWEQTSQYQASLLYPTSQFSYIPAFIQRTHLNLLHEDNRYENFYHLQYWHLLHGVEFAGQLWQHAQHGEDAVQAYKRLTNITQQQFNDEIYDYARRTLTWDFLHKSSYTSYILSTSAANSHQTTLTDVGGGYYRVAPAKCVQNYGFNAARLTVPVAGTTVTATFEGIAGTAGYNSTYVQYAGWRYGFVAISTDREATYSTVHNTVTGEVTFAIPANTSRLYFLVTGAPTTHFQHIWDDNPANDEQYPWQARFTNTSPQ